MKKLPIGTEGESQVLNEAFGAPIQRPAPALGPVLNAFACVRGGEPKIGKDGSLRKWRQWHVDGGKCRLYDACRPAARAVAPSERLDHREDHDADHENGWYLIENPIESLRMRIAVGGEFAHAAHKKAM